MTTKQPWQLTKEEEQTLWEQTTFWKKQQTAKSEEFSRVAQDIAPIFADEKKARTIIDACKKNLPLQSKWNYFMVGVTILFSKATFSKDSVLFKIPSLIKLGSNAKDPEMQKALIKETPVLDAIGQNAEAVKSIADSFLPGDENTTLRKVAGAAVDLFANEETKNTLKEELLNNYFKSSVPNVDTTHPESFLNPNIFKANYVDYEKKFVTTKQNLKAAVKRRLDARQGIKFNELDRAENSKDILEKELRYLGGQGAERGSI